MIDAELEEQIRVTKAAATALTGEAPPGSERSVSVRDFLADLQKAATLTEDQRSYLTALLKLESFEGSSTVALPITVKNDPAQQPTTDTTTSLAPAPAADSTFAQNVSDISKKVDVLVAKLTKEIEGKAGPLEVGLRTALAKATATEKLAEVSKVFGIQVDPSAEMWELRSQVGDLVSLLCQQVKLEAMLGTTATTTKAAGGDSEAWPEDMAKAAYDKGKGRFVSEKPLWGRDSSSVR